MERFTHTPDLLAEAREVILAALRDGPPLTLPEIPRRWPITRPMLSFLVRELLAAGLLAPVPGGRIPGQTAYALTAAGRNAAGSSRIDSIRLPAHEGPDRASA